MTHSLLSLILTATVLPTPTETRETALAHQGKPVCPITVLDVANPTQMKLAKELAEWLQQSVGEPFEIRDGEPQSGIILGLWNQVEHFLPRDWAPPSVSEGYSLQTDGDRAWILGHDILGLQQAVYGFLHHLGCRWFFPDPAWAVIPKQPDLSVRLNVRTGPAFLHRRIWYGWGPRTEKLAQDYQAWLRHNRQLGAFGIDCGHAYERYIPHSEFDRHPEWFSLVAGKREPRQLCVSNPEVQERVINGVLELFRRNPERNMASVEPNDGSGYCECDHCKPIGTPSDQAFFLANRVAQTLAEHFPGKWVGLLAYAGHSDPPSFPLAPNVYVQITTGFRYTKLSFEEQVSRFRELGAQVGVYDYFSVYPWDWDMPGAAKAGRVYELAAAIRHYHDLGLTTYDAESSCNWAPNGPGYWIAAQLMWDPNLPIELLITDFCEKAFGPASKPMRRLYERWWRGERFSGRNLKLALTDLQEAYALTSEEKTRIRLDRIAMYLHWLRLWRQYDRSARWNQWGRVVTAEPQEILAHAEEFVRYTRRIMDTGLVHAFPALYTEWFRHRMAALGKLPGFDWKLAEDWPKSTTLPSPEEVRKDFEADLRALSSVQAGEITGRSFAGRLLPAAEAATEEVDAWQGISPSPVFVESGLFLFQSKGPETIALKYRPFDSGHTIDCRWHLYSVGADPQLTVITSGHLKAEKGKSAELILEIPAKGNFAFDPGTGYWRAAEIVFDSRPLVLWAGRPLGPVTGNWPSFRLWLPRSSQPLYFYVPSTVPHFVIGVVSGGDPYTRLRITRADGTLVAEELMLAGDQITIFLQNPPSDSGDISTKASSGAFLGESSQSPNPRKGEILALQVDSLRCELELYDIPPFLARHPAELLVPADALQESSSHTPKPQIRQSPAK